MDISPTRKERSRQRIVEAAARSIRAKGYDGVGVADVMKQAGLTHGGFYAHFASREALLVEAVEQAGRTSGALLAEKTVRCGPLAPAPFAPWSKPICQMRC